LLGLASNSNPLDLSFPNSRREPFAQALVRQRGTGCKRWERQRFLFQVQLCLWLRS
jgi:hypothetical protein